MALDPQDIPVPILSQARSAKALLKRRQGRGRDQSISSKLPLYLALLGEVDRGGIWETQSDRLNIAQCFSSLLLAELIEQSLRFGKQVSMDVVVSDGTVGV